MIDGASVLWGEQGQLFTPDGEPVWMTNDGRLIPPTRIDDDHLAAIRSFLHGDPEGRDTWMGHVDEEIARRKRKD